MSQSLTSDAPPSPPFLGGFLNEMNENHKNLPRLLSLSSVIAAHGIRHGGRFIYSLWLLSYAARVAGNQESPSLAPFLLASILTNQFKTKLA